ncbi:MAG: amino acid permease, partial [Actinobacteria bacterium]|nr:amino acid permease [Actinomycetota bacterium]
PKSWTDGAPQPVALQDHAHLKDSFSYKIKRRLLGGPLNRHSLGHQRLSKRYALGILSSDCISSSAYGSEQILIALLPAFGLAAFAILMPMTAVVLIILTIITLSYRNVIDVYTKTGGAYIVARDNFGPVVAQIAAVALMLDYIVTVAIQSAAGVAAIISTFPSLDPWKLPMIFAVIALLTYGNLRGVKEAGKAFAFPTYFFVGSMFIVFGMGMWRLSQGTLPVLATDLPGAVHVGEAQGLLTFASIFILLRAFANGGSSLTGLEAISDGVALFREPEHVNAKRTLVVMSSLLGTLVLGVSWFAHHIHAMPYESGTPTVISQIAKAAVGTGTFGSIMFIMVQLATMLILFAGANTTYSAFPLLCNFVASDGYLPRQLTKRGHRLAFSNGILLLSGGGLLLVLITAGSVEHLVAFYALGVFTGFTLAGFGMTKHSLRNKPKGWRLKVVVNATAGSVSLAIVIIFSVVKFTEGAWMVLLLAPILVASFLRLRRQYTREVEALSVRQEQERATAIVRHDVTVLVDNVDLATLGAIRYARSLKPRNLSAVHFVIDDRHAEDISRAWATSDAFDDVTLELIDCPDRRIANSAVDYAIRMTERSDVELTLLLPRRSYSPFLGRLLHDQTAEEIAAPISQLQRVVATIVPFDVDKITSGNRVALHEKHDSRITEKPKPVAVKQIKEITRQVEPVSHYEANVTPIGEIEWRKRAHVQGQVTSIKTAPRGGAPLLEVEVWDQTGGVTLHFLGRREIAGLEVGSKLRAEGMVGEEEGVLTILNPSYELLV